MKALILLWLLALPVYGEDRADPRKPDQLEVIATAIDAVSTEAAAPRKMAALLLATGWNETGWSLRVHDGHCKSWECDGGRARGPWQTQRNSMPLERWEQMRGFQNTRAQAEAARERILLGLAQCHGSERGAIARYLGHACDARSEQLDDRYDWYMRAYRALEPVKPVDAVAEQSL
jgi:hypothetical protein